MPGTSTPPMAQPRVAAGVLIRSEDGSAVLLVRPTYKDGWDIPGGYVEPGETPVQACRREVAEELGLTDYEVGRALVVDWAPHPSEGDKLLFVFDGGTMTQEAAAALVLGADEIAEARFWPIDAMADRTPERLSRRLLLAVEAIEAPATTYAEGGSPAPVAMPVPRPRPDAA